MSRRPIQMELSLEERISHGAIRLAAVNTRGIAYKIPRIRLASYIKTLTTERDADFNQRRTPTFVFTSHIFLVLKPASRIYFLALEQQNAQCATTNTTSYDDSAHLPSDV